MSRHRRQQRRRAGRARGLTQNEVNRMHAEFLAAEMAAASEPCKLSNAVATADALFGALGFRRVE